MEFSRSFSSATKKSIGKALSYKLGIRIHHRISFPFNWYILVFYVIKISPTIQLQPPVFKPQTTHIPLIRSDEKAGTRNVSFSIPPRWPPHPINSVYRAEIFVFQSLADAHHISLETSPFIHLLGITKSM